ncbi:trypsin-like peptidase domain-containing protein [Facklamia sp. DSM 111018]|uniref:Trypsin-like peptidase domain-containing protein n=1 Tax=Facklamia lactis TaxID=2749967 RepID=A0ABS0LRE8_9LACT|nr:trypsin-like peptidase domain-containing protein [Facklamia lactis]MBG9980760.1 trypsin-like peptidase domain-containing protein [Facklamia lactis]MBG9986574.1 trypsin-like peptidase domain-containing protein [Facklamia lactis]
MLNDHFKASSANLKKWKRIFRGVSASTLTILLAAGIITSHEDLAFSRENTEQVSSQVQTLEPEALSNEEQKIVDTVNQASEAVVSIANLQNVGSQLDPYSQYQSNNYFMPEEENRNLQPVGEGSGVIYRIDGDQAYIVTNHHVIEGAEALEVQLKNGETLDAELIGSDSLSDLAVLKMDSAGIEKALEFADSDKIQVGQTAIAIGSPLGSDFATSVTKGIVSGLNRSVPVDTDGDMTPDWDMNLLQTDAAISPGNSGGALINSAGQLIGINSSKLSARGVEGMGFAIPTNDVVDIVSQLEENGEVIRPVLGIRYTSLDRIHPDYRTEVMGLDQEELNGAFVMEVVPESSADKAGIEKYDLITALDGEEIEGTADLKQKLYKYRVGDKINVTIRRKSEEKEIEVNLDAAIEEENIQSTTPLEPLQPESEENENSLF